VLIGRNGRAAYSGASLAFRDRLVIEWNKTQQRQTFADQKRVYCGQTPPFPHPAWLC
jgi:starch phosphorylase